MTLQCPYRPMPELEKIYEREAKVSLQRQDSTGRIISPRGGYSPRIAYGSDPEELIRRLVLQKRVDLNQPIRIGGTHSACSRRLSLEMNRIRSAH